MRRVETTPRQTVLLRRIIDRIRNSLELNTVLQTAVDEIASLLRLDRCLFFWYFQELGQVQIVCEHGRTGQSAALGHYPIADLALLAAVLEKSEVVVDSGTETAFLHWNWLKRYCNPQSKTVQPNAPAFGAAASLWMPIQVGTDSTGFLACLSDQPRRWSTAEVDLIQSIAQQLEIAIRQAQLYERTQKQARREQLINQITTQTRQSFDLKTLLREAIAQLLEAMEVDRCLVHLVEDPEADVEPLELAQTEPKLNQVFRRKHLFEVCRPPFSPSIADFDTNGPMTQWVIQYRRQVVIADIAQDARIGSDNAEYRLAQIKSSLVVPVQANGKLLAILYLNQCAAIRYWSKEDQSLAQAIADQLAISIQHRLLYAQMRQQASESAEQARYLTDLLQHLHQTQAQLIQSEKLSSLGQLVAGIAHEINNPISFIYGNVPYVERYVQDLVRLLAAYQSHVSPSDRLHALETEIELDFLLQDLPRILQSMKSGASRIREMVRSLRNFSHLDEAHCKIADVHQGLDSTLEVLHHQLSQIEVKRCYGELPEIECYPRLLNQVFMNLLINAIEALNVSEAEPKNITIQTRVIQHEQTHEPWIQIAIADNGCGIAEAIQSRVYDPFFTTKSVGQGTGLGLAVSYQTIVYHHQGTLKFQSQIGQGAEFVIAIPVKHPNGRVRDRNQQLTQSQMTHTTTEIMKMMPSNGGQR